MPASVKHTRAQAEIFHDVVSRLGANPELIRHDGELAAMADSLGNMSAEYMNDIQRAFAGGDERGYTADTGAKANLRGLETYDGLIDFLRATAEDPDAYATITHAQQAVTTDMMREALTDPGDNPLSNVAEVAAKPGGVISGITAEGRAEAIAAADDGVEKSEEFNSRMATLDEYVTKLVDMTVAQVPVGGDAAGAVIGKIQESVFGHFIQDPEEAAREIEENRKDYLEGQRERAAQASKRAVFDGAERAGLSRESDDVKLAADAVYQEVNDSYADGKGR
ncbi:hypothetical protein ACQUSR_23585 [Streptomyces sp. P1-3]|uniref:hypothetical protein n=1 Tax=Streptomyces sp. P1-3 TaxID=3421658 RepID=UPI003D360B7A